MVRRSAGPAADDRGTLYIVATPIGNLADMSQRAIDTLAAADIILAEDTRVSRVLLEHFGITTRMVAAHEHNSARTIPQVIERLSTGERVAVITDAGTPLISDPGSKLVQAVRAAGFRVSPVPGASAVTAALSASGIEPTPFTFVGFLPKTGKDRRIALELVHSLSHAVVLYEAPGRVADTLEEIATSGRPDRRCVVAREITKLFEEFRDGTVEELAAYYAGNPPRGEVVILLAPQEAKPFNEEDLRGRVKALREAGVSAKDAAAQVSSETGVPRNTVYKLAVKT
jgi:16S rRNA (cytidine1402-2'-O)-methyltransferase